MAHCLTWPSSLRPLLDFFSFLSADVVAESRVPCAFDGFDYFTRVKLAVGAPLGCTAFFFVIGFSWAQLKALCGAGGSSAATSAAAAVARKDSTDSTRSHWRKTLVQKEMEVIEQGVWFSLAPTLFTLDLLYPAISRTLFQFFSCRDVGEAGKFLEADLSIRCDEPDGTYQSYKFWVGASAALYSVGVPALLLHLVRKMRKQGRLHHKLVARALSWIHLPFRRGKSWWCVAEMTRVLMLSSWVGFIGKMCWTKVCKFCPNI